MARLDSLDVLSRKILQGKLQGERRSKRRGQSVEFADHRAYVVGDDLRFVDWNIYGRLDQLFLKLFLEEQDLTVHVLADTSASMGVGEPAKDLFAKRLTAALGYISLVNNNRLTVSLFGDGVRVAVAERAGTQLSAAVGRDAPDDRMRRLLGFREGLSRRGGGSIRLGRDHRDLGLPVQARLRSCPAAAPRVAVRSLRDPGALAAGDRAGTDGRPQAARRRGRAIWPRSR